MHGRWLALGVRTPRGLHGEIGVKGTTPGQRATFLLPTCLFGQSRSCSLSRPVSVPSFWVCRMSIAIIPAHPPVQPARFHRQPALSHSSAADCSHAHACHLAAPGTKGPFLETLPSLPPFTPRHTASPPRRIPPSLRTHLSSHPRCSVATRLPPLHARRQLLAFIETFRLSRLPRPCLAA